MGDSIVLGWFPAFFSSVVAVDASDSASDSLVSVRFLDRVDFDSLG